MTSTQDQISAQPSAAVMGTYGRFNIVFEKGEGSWLISTDGKRFLDFGSGIAVNAVGHAHPHLIDALTKQAHQLWHTSNLYRIKGQERLAERLVANSFADKVFFCNSGAEACEGAIKLARRYQFASGKPERTRIITFKGSFHGRTLATLAAAGNEKYLEGFGERAGGFDILDAGDLDLVAKTITDKTAAIMIEPVQMEGGVRVIAKEFLQGLRKLCDDNGLLLVFDEVQTGVGRSGKLFSYELTGIAPDVMAIAKGIGGGFPLGAFMATEEAAKGMVPGTHGSTFGGNPLATAVGNAVLDVVLEPGFLEAVQQKALRFKQALAGLKDEYPDLIAEVRGQGLMLGIKMVPVNSEIVTEIMNQGLLCVGAGDNVIRLLPPLNVKDEEISDAIERISKAIAAYAAKKKSA